MGCILPRPQLYDLLFPSSHPLTSTGVISRRGKSTGRSMSELIPVGPVMREKTPVLQVSHQDFLLLASAPTALDNLLQEELPHLVVEEYRAPGAVVQFFEGIHTR